MFKYLFLAGIARFSVELFRLNPKYIYGLSGAQIISIIMIVSAIVLFQIYKTKRSVPESNE